MKISQVLHAMDRDNPLLPLHVTMLMADSDVIVLDVGREERRK